MEPPKVSISVPVYNVERYLKKCLDSLLSQTLKEIEIIIVNDGSTDNSESICLEYAEKDNRIKYVTKKNGGLSSARQTALDCATGEFFCACDADDWVEPTIYEHLYCKAIETGADVVMCDYYTEYFNKRCAMSYGKELPSNNNLIIKEALNGSFLCSVWSKLYKRDLFKKYNVSWEQGINMGEDFLITLKILQHPIKVVYLPEKLYHYRRLPGEDSYTNKVTLDSYNQLLRIHEWIEHNIDKQLFEDGILNNLNNLAFTGLRVKEGMTPNYLNSTTIEKLDYTFLLKKHSLKSLLVLYTKLFGYNAGLLLYKTMYKFVYR